MTLDLAHFDLTSCGDCAGPGGCGCPDGRVPGNEDLPPIFLATEDYLDRLRNCAHDEVPPLPGATCGVCGADLERVAS